MRNFQNVRLFVSLHANENISDVDCVDLVVFAEQDLFENSIKVHVY